MWTTDSQSLSDFEILHFCRYFPILFDSRGHSLLSSLVQLIFSLGVPSGQTIVTNMTAYQSRPLHESTKTSIKRTVDILLGGLLPLYW